MDKRTKADGLIFTTYPKRAHKENETITDG